MKLTIQKSACLSALSPVANIVSEKATIPVYQNVSIEAFADGSVVFRGRNEGLEATASADALVMATGAITVTAETFADIVRKSSGDEISLKQDAPTDRLEVRAGRSLFRLAPLPISDFPPFPERDYAITFEIAGATLADAIERVRWAIHKSKGSHAFPMAGVRFAVNGDELHIIALNGNQFSHVKLDRPPDWPDDLGVTVGPETLDQLVSVGNSARGELVQLAIMPGRIAIQSGRVFLSGNTLVNETFPQYLAMEEKFTSKTDIHMKVHRAALMDAINRILSVGNLWQKTDKAIRIECEEDSMTISAKSHAGEATESIPVEGGRGVTLGYNPDFLLPALAQIEGEELTIELTHDRERKTESATILRGENNDLLVIVAQRMV